MASVCTTYLRLFVHLVIFAWYLFTLDVICSIPPSDRHPAGRSYGRRWKNVTFINLVMQTQFFGLCVLTDLTQVVFPRKSKCSSFLMTLQEFFFTALAFPIAGFVFTSFWFIYTYDRELVFPRVLDEIIPTWLNHAMHTVILPLVLVQMCLQHHTHPSRSRGILALALFSALYLTWVLWIHHASGIWVYPIMAHLSPAGLIMFLSVAALSMVPLYLLGEKLNHVIWGPAADAVSHTQSHTQSRSRKGNQKNKKN